MGKDINMILAMGKDGAIGINGNLIWKIPGDLKRFKDLTLGHPVIMGRKTWESLPKRPLPGRRNIVLTRQKDFESPGAEVVDSIDKALKITENQEPFIIGGAEIYNAFLPFTTRLFLTLVDDSCPDADARLTLDLENDWIEENREVDESNPDGITFRYINFRKKS